MYLNTKLEDFKGDIKVAFIGCGKFISMFLSQYNQLKKIKIDSIIDLKIDNAKKNCLNSGLSNEQIKEINFTNSLDEAIERDIDIFIEATGNPIVGTVHADKIIRKKKHLILVNVEADVTCGKYLSDLAKQNNVICSMAYGDQPSLIVEQIEWAKLNGFSVICAGKGTKYHPTFEYSTPDTVWNHYGLSKESAEIDSGMNPKMFNSFLCGDKSAIEMCAVSNASNLICPKNGLTFPPIGVYDIAKKLIPKSEGGLIDFDGQVEVISSIDLEKKDIANDFEYIGSHLNYMTVRETTVLDSESLNTLWGAGLEIIGDIYENPVFPENEIKRKVKEQITELSTIKDSPNALARIIFPQIIYGDDSRFGHPILGAADSLSVIKQQDIIKHHKSRDTNETFLIVTGNTTLEEIEKYSDQAFRQKYNTIDRKHSPNIELEKLPIYNIIDLPGAPQTVIRVGFPWKGRKDLSLIHI